MIHKLNQLCWLLLSLIIISTDQFTKYLINTNFVLGETKPITSYFNLVLAHNYGAAFSFLNQAGGWQRWLFASLSTVITLAIIIWLFLLAKNQRLMSLALSLIIGGALGNLIDRLSQGYVVDFLDIYINIYHWPAFNVADSAVCIGAIILSFSLWRTE